jgi:hypothetical protein
MPGAAPVIKVVAQSPPVQMSKSNSGEVPDATPMGKLAHMASPPPGLGTDTQLIVSTTVVPSVVNVVPAIEPL